MGTSDERRARLAAKQKRDGEKKSGNNYRVLDTKAFPDIEWVKPELGVTYAWDLIPYEVTSRLHPEYDILKEDGLMEDYKLDLWVHKAIGASKKNLVCPKKTYGKPCPICEEHDRIREENKDLDWNSKELKDLIGDMRPSQKSFFNLRDLEDGGKPKFFEYSTYWFTKNLIEQSNMKSRKRQIFLQDFSDEGTTIEFQFSKSTFDDKKVGEVKAFTFEEREEGEGYTEEDIANAPKLDTLVKLLSYDEISAIFYGTEDDETEDDKEEVVETRSSRRAKVEEPEVETRSSRRSRKEAVEEEPVQETSRRSRRERTPEPEVEADPVCPVGLKWGEDIDTKNCSADCELYDSCDAEYEKNNA